MICGIIIIAIIASVVKYFYKKIIKGVRLTGIEPITCP